MTIQDFRDLKEEILVYLRNNLHSSDHKNRMTLGSEVGTADGTATYTMTSVSGLSAVSGISVNSVVQTNFIDYIVDYKNTTPRTSPSITFTSTPVSGQEVIIYYWTGTEWIYPDFPKNSLSMNSFPRIAFDVITQTREPFGIGGTVFKSDITFQMNAYSDKHYEVDEYLHKAGSVFMKNAKGFNSFEFVIPMGLGPSGKVPGRNEDIITQSQDFMLKNIFDEV